MFRTLSFLLPVAALVACDEPTFTYELDAEIVVPAEVARAVEAPMLLEVEWMGERHGLELLCEPVEGEIRAGFSGTVQTEGHVSHQLFTARLLPWPADRACDPALVGEVYVDPVGPAPFAHVFVFEDDASSMGARDSERAESVTVELALEE